jgi:hypothetical protein
VQGASSAREPMMAFDRLPGQFDHSVGAQRRHRGAGGVGEDAGVGGSLAGRKLGSVEQDRPYEGRPNRPEQLGQMLGAGEMVEHLRWGSRDGRLGLNARRAFVLQRDGCGIVDRRIGASPGHALAGSARSRAIASMHAAIDRFDGCEHDE